MMSVDQLKVDSTIVAAPFIYSRVVIFKLWWCLISKYNTNYTTFTLREKKATR